MKCACQNLLLLIISLLTSCRETAIDYVLPYSGDVLVLNGVIIADRKMEFEVSKTFPASGEVPEFTQIDGCKLEIYENGDLAETILATGQAKYISSKIALPDKKYQIKVSCDGFKPLSTNEILVPRSLPKVSFELDRTVESIVNTNIKQWRISSQMEALQDNNLSKFYFQSFVTTFPTEPLTISQFWEKSNVNTVEQNECNLRFDLYLPDYMLNTKIFSSDCLIDNKIRNEYYVEVERNIILNGEPFQIVKQEASEVEFIYGIASKEFYDFVKVENRQPGNIGRLWKEPVTTYSNVTGGYGVVYAINIKTIILR